MFISPTIFSNRRFSKAELSGVRDPEPEAAATAPWAPEAIVPGA